jgi:hypothetical protein
MASVSWSLHVTDEYKYNLRSHCGEDVNHGLVGCDTILSSKWLPSFRETYPGDEGYTSLRNVGESPTRPYDVTTRRPKGMLKNTFIVNKYIYYSY